MSSSSPVQSPREFGESSWIHVEGTQGAPGGPNPPISPSPSLNLDTMSSASESHPPAPAPAKPFETVPPTPKNSPRRGGCCAGFFRATIQWIVQICAPRSNKGEKLHE